MGRLITIICVLLLFLSVPLWILIAGFSPGLLPSSHANTPKLVERILGPTMFLAIWLIPLWAAYFFWRVVKAWRAGLSSTGPAMLMVLPSTLVIGFILFVNFKGVAP